MVSRVGAFGGDVAEADVVDRRTDGQTSSFAPKRTVGTLGSRGPVRFLLLLVGGRVSYQAQPPPPPPPGREYSVPPPGIFYPPPLGLAATSLFAGSVGLLAM